MRRMLALTAIAVSLMFANSAANAQAVILNLPRASQRATVVQRVGLTDISVTYHRPVANGRKVWGGLVPYGQVWRAGANENTVVEFTDPVTVEGKPLAKGVYGLHMIPGENEFTVIFSRQANAWGSFSYKQDEDALRVTVKPHPAEMEEALAYTFDDVAPDAATLTLRWEKLAVPVKIGVDSPEVVAEKISNQLRGFPQYTWQGWDDAGTYLLSTKKHLDDALKYEHRSITLEERFENLMTKSQILDAMSRKDEATATRNRAMAVANAVQLHQYGRGLQLQGKQDEAFAVFRTNIQKNPDHWLVHSEAARLAVAKGDYDGALKEMKLCLKDAPAQFQPAFQGLLKRVEAKEDINK